MGYGPSETTRLHDPAHPIETRAVGGHRDILRRGRRCAPIARPAERGRNVKLREAGLTWHVVDDEVIVLDLDGSVYLQLNGSGRVLWEMLTDPRTAADLTAALVDRYGIERQRADADVADFVAELERRGLLAN